MYADLSEATTRMAARIPTTIRTRAITITWAIRDPITGNLKNNFPLNAYWVKIKSKV